MFEKEKSQLDWTHFCAFLEHPSYVAKIITAQKLQNPGGNEPVDLEIHIHVGILYIYM